MSVLPLLMTATVLSLAQAQEPAPHGPLPLTLEEAKERALANNKLLALAALNVEGKGYAVKVARADYFPQIIGNSVYFRFDNNLGDVLTNANRGRALLPPIAVDVAVLQQNTSFNTAYAAQPITALLKVRQGVKIARADEHIAQAQLEKAKREVAAGVEQLFWGLLATRRIRAGTLIALEGAQELARTGNLEARTAVVQVRQGLLEVERQIADLRGQMVLLLDLPPCTSLELIEPPLPAVPVTCCDEVVEQALACSPEINEAEQNVTKAHAAVAAAKVDYLPNVAVVGGYLNQTAANYIQPNIGYVGVFGSYTFLDWGKRKNTLRGRENLVCLANLKVQQTRDEVRQQAVKTFEEYQGSQAALQLAGELLVLRKEAEKAAVLPAAKFKAAKDRMTAEVDYVKADLALRTASVKLMSLIGKI